MAIDPRVEAALRRRDPLQLHAGTNCYRLINGQADGFPEVTVDRYAEVLVANLYSRGRRVEPPTRLLKSLMQQTGARAVYVKYRPEQANLLDEAARRALAPPEPLLGQGLDEVEVLENGLRFIVRPGDGLSTGLFLDMRETRAWVRAKARGLSVLNCFAYTCAFGVAALMGGAARAANLDIARHYLDWGQNNARRNGLTPVATDFIFGDVFDWLRRFRRAGQSFDLVILDPPSYATTRKSRFSVERDFAQLVAQAAEVVAPGGRLLACANAHTLPARAFLAQVRRGLAGHAAQVGRAWHEPALDFPVAAGAEPYLKVCAVRFEEHK